MTETCLLLVFVSDGDGIAAWLFVLQAIVGHGSGDRDARKSPLNRRRLAGLLMSRQEEATCEGSAASRCAASAISLAAWISP